jgi:hypothetical protein
VALAALVTFGCAVVRAPASGMSEAIPVKDGAADPQLALWVEGGEAPSPAETEDARARAQAALSEAARGLEAPDGNLLVIRAQGVTRTRGRRHDQVAGAVGLVVGAAVVIVVAIVALSQGKGGGGKGGPKGAPARAAPSPRSGGGGGARPAPLPVPTRGPRFSPAPQPFAPRFPHDGVPVYGGPDVQLGLWFDLSGPVPYVPPPAEAGFPQPIASYGATPAAPDEGDDLSFEPDAPRPLSEVRLSAPEPLPLDDRGFFAGDDLLVELVAVDRLTGEPRLRKLARRSVDPTNAVEVRKFLRRAVAEGAWEPVPVQPAP